MNVVLADGNVEADTLRHWTLPAPEHRRRWNRDHLPHPEHWNRLNPDDWNP